MKKLSNVSPFLLLLFPVFIMMLFAFTTISNTTNQEEEIAIKTTKSATGVVIKATAAILK